MDARMNSRNSRTSPTNRLYTALLAASAFGCVFAVSPSTQAATLFGQAVGSGAIPSDVDSPNIWADNFSLTSDSTITDVLWNGIYYNTGTPQVADAFTIAFYNDNSGSVGSLAGSFNVGNNVNRTDTGSNYSAAIDIFSYSTGISGGLALAAGDYWVSIFNDTTSDTDDTWDWLWSGDGDTKSSAYSNTGSFWGASGVDLAFALEGSVSAVPLPATLPLFASALAGMGFAGWRRKRSAA